MQIGINIAVKGSSASTPLPPAPVNTVAPLISGPNSPNYYDGDLITTTNGTWTNSPISYTYQWYRNSGQIIGETSSTYLLSFEDIENSISCQITATNAGGSTPIYSSNSAYIYG